LQHDYLVVMLVDQADGRVGRFDGGIGGADGRVGRPDGRVGGAGGDVAGRYLARTRANGAEHP
jgi:hypothetical protein